MRRNTKSSGFSLLEMIVVTAIFALTMLTILLTITRSQDDYTDYTVGTEIRDRARVVMDRMESELRESSFQAPDFALVDGSTTIVFNQCTGFDGVDTTWSTPVTYTLTPQGQLTRTQNGQTIIMATSVSSLSFSQGSGSVTAQIAIAKTGTTGRRISQTFDTTIFLRN